MQKLLFVSPELPFPPRSGGKVKSHKLLSMLCEHFEVTLVCPLKLEDGEFLEEFQQTVPLKHIACEPINIKRNAQNLLLSYLKSKPLNLYRSFVPSLAEFVSQNHSSYDRIFVDHFEAFQYVPQHFVGQVIYHAHNAYFKMWQRYSETSENAIYRCVTSLEAKRVRAAELDCCEKADLVFAAPNDIEELTRLGAPADKFSPTYHLGDDSQLAQPDIEFHATERRLVYVGFLGWEPNAVGLLWFLNEVWPILKQSVPDIGIDIIGKKPDERLQAIAIHDDNVCLRGFVADLEDYIPRSRVSIAPLHFGSGMKVKVLSSMARGLPIVTTDVGAEGIEVNDGQHLLIRNDAQGMADAILSLFEDQESWTTLRDESRALIRQKYTWEALFNSMREAMESKL